MPKELSFFLPSLFFIVSVRLGRHLSLDYSFPLVDPGATFSLLYMGLYTYRV